MELALRYELNFTSFDESCLILRKRRSEIPKN